MFQGSPQINSNFFFLPSVYFFVFSQLFFPRKNEWRLLRKTALSHNVAAAQAGYLYGSWGLDKAYLLGLLAKIKCSICSYQLNLWYVDKSRHDD